MNRAGLKVYYRTRRARAIQWRFPPCSAPKSCNWRVWSRELKGLPITHWTSQDLARQAVAEGIVPQLSACSVRRILREIDLQPHRTGYWKTARRDARFKQRAEKILWCHANARRLLRSGLWVVCVDEMPTLQALEREPIRRAIPSSIEQQEFEYVRHGTVNVRLFLIVHSGRLEATCPAYKDADHYVQAVPQFRQHPRHLRGVFLIQDGDPSPTAAATEHYFRQQSGWRPRFTPVHASWLNQAELLNEAFSFYYLKRGSWHSHQELTDHIEAAWPEYNELYAHPFEWTWTNQNMRRWFAEHATDHV
jgi:DDE superfamily endonuclease